MVMSDAKLNWDIITAMNIAFRIQCPTLYTETSYVHIFYMSHQFYLMFTKHIEWL